jgi:hypothetical protein
MLDTVRMRKLCAKFVTHRLKDEQKQHRLTSRKDCVQTCQDNPSFKVKTALKGKRFQDA